MILKGLLKLPGSFASSRLSVMPRRVRLADKRIILALAGLPTERRMSANMSKVSCEDGLSEHGGMPSPPSPTPQVPSFDSRMPAENLPPLRVPSIDGDTPRTSVLMELTDRVGVLHDVLRYFWKYDVNICRIESRPVRLVASPTGQLRAFDFFVDVEGSPSDVNVGKLLDALR